MGVQVNSYFKSKYTGAQIENMLDAFGNTAAAYETSTAYSVGDLVLYNNALYVCTGATTGAFDPSKWQQTTLAELVENLGATYTDPNSDGNVVVGVDSTTGNEILRSITFPTLTKKYYLPFAQYIRTNASNDPSNASFSIEIPDAEEAPMHSTIIKGKTAAVNQLVQNGNFADTSGWTTYSSTISASANVATVTGTGNQPAIYRNFSVVMGRRYYFRATLKGDGTKDVRIRTDGGVEVDSRTTSSSFVAAESIATATSTSSSARFILEAMGASSGFVFQAKDAMAIDLSLIFTATELTAIGTDVAKLKSAWLKKYGTPLPQYIPHDAGSLANVNGVYRLRGRNLWDEEWEQGTINNTTGQNVSDNTVWRSKNYIPIKQGTDIYFHCGGLTSSLRFYWYDANYNFLYTSTVLNESLTPVEGTRYLRIRGVPADGAAYKGGICINESDASFNGQFEKAYNGGTIDCSTAPLNGIGTAQDEKDFATGKRVTRCGNFTPGDVTWTRSGDSPSGGNLFVYGNLSDRASGRNKLIMSHYPNDESASSAPNIRNGYCWTHPNNKNVYVRDDAYSDAASFKAHLQAINAQGCYELATPVVSTETPQPLETQYGYNVLEPVSGGVQSGEVDTTYYENIAGYIDKRLNGG